MNTYNIINLLIRPTRLSVMIICLMVFHSVSAKSAPPKPKQNTTSQPALILTLPEQIPSSGINGLTNSASNAGIENQIIAEHHKKAPVDLDCDMNLLQNTSPDVSLTGRLSGECDVKYHY